MGVTRLDVAKHAGVSARTVSNVVTGSVPVRPDTKAKVLASIQALGYRPNVSARQLRLGRTSTITLAIPSLISRYYAHLAQVVIEQASQVDLQVLVMVTQDDPAAEGALLRGENLLTDGVILVERGELDDDADHSAVGAPDFPIVTLGNGPGVGDITHIGPDNAAAAKEAVAHLVERGCRRILALGATSGPAHTSEVRLAGYRAALQQGGLAVEDDLLVPCPWNSEGGEAAMSDYLARPDTPEFDGVFAFVDAIALGAMKSLQLAGRQIPDDVAVVGFENIPAAAQSFPGLTSVDPGTAEIARIGLAELVRQLGGGTRTAAEHVVPHRLIVRPSSAAT